MDGICIVSFKEDMGHGKLQDTNVYNDNNGLSRVMTVAVVVWCVNSSVRHKQMMSPRSRYEIRDRGNDSTLRGQDRI